MSETWLNEYNEENFPIAGYHPIVSNIRKYNSSLGGVALFIREDLEFDKRPDLGNFIPCVFESVLVTLIHYHVTLGAIYRTPSSDPEHFLSQSSQKKASFYWVTTILTGLNIMKIQTSQNSRI